MSNHAIVSGPFQKKGLVSVRMRARVRRLRRSADSAQLHLQPLASLTASKCRIENTRCKSNRLGLPFLQVLFSVKRAERGVGAL